MGCHTDNLYVHNFDDEKEETTAKRSRGRSRRRSRWSGGQRRGSSQSLSGSSWHPRVGSGKRGKGGSIGDRGGPEDLGLCL